MLGNFRNKDTLQIFNETWKVNHNIKRNINNLSKSNLNSMTPSSQAKRVTNQINNNNMMQRNEFIDKFK